MKYGYAGQILHIDLSNGSFEVEKPDEAFYRKYLGGSAVGCYYLLRLMSPGIDPFSPENVLALSIGVMTGAPISGQSRMTATAKSPLTNAIGDSQCGGFFPAEMKFAGFDAIIIHGRSERPTYLWIHDGQVDFHSADHLWGKEAGEAEQLIQDELGDKRIEVLQCGPAGEKLVRFASLVNMSNRANGRTGMGAVMGSKNLKAIAVRGRRRPAVADPASLKGLATWGAETLVDSDVYGMQLLGTAEAVSAQNADGGLPTRNWESGEFSGAEMISGLTMSETILKRNDTCFACAVRCKRVVEVREGPYLVDPLYGGPEYETIATFGSYCGTDDLAAIAYANQLCNMYGMDTISCGATIAWAMDCYERGIITDHDTDGLELRFGNAEAMVQMTERIARREGFGDLLAEGSARAAAKIGRGAEDLVVACKKEEYPAHMPQVKPSLGLIYSVNPFGADHVSSEHDPGYSIYPDRMLEIGLDDPEGTEGLDQETVKFALTTQHAYSLMDSLCVCLFVYGPAYQLYSIGQLRDAVQAVTGWDVTIEELLEVGERRLNMLKAFNAREGFDRKDDTLPKKILQPLKGGASDGFHLTELDIERAKDLYYEMAGWDARTGNPRACTLAHLGLEWITDWEQPYPQAGPADEFA